MARTVATLAFIGERHAVFLNPNGVTGLNGGLFSPCDGTDGACGTHFGAFHTFGAAKSALERRCGLHEGGQIGRRAQHIVGTSRYAELASRTMLRHVGCTERARRCHRRLAHGSHFLFHYGQSAVHLFPLLSQRCRGRQGRCGQEGAACAVGSGLCFRRNYGRLSLTRRITDGLLIAFADAVATDDATAVVHATVLEVDARGLAILGTQSALDAAVAVDAHLQP